jgi:hypothetical protein
LAQIPNTQARKELCHGWSASRCVAQEKSWKELNMQRWSTRFADHSRLIIECFPAAAIWAAKRLGGYPARTSGTAIKSYKKQQGKLLSESDTENLVGDVLLSSFEHLTGLPNHWPTMVQKLISLMLQRKGWGKDGNYSLALRRGAGQAAKVLRRERQNIHRAALPPRY